MEITSVAVRCILAIGPVTMSDLTDQTILNRYRVETKDVATSCENSDALLLHRSVPVLRRAHSSTGWCCAPRS